MAPVSLPSLVVTADALPELRPDRPAVRADIRTKRITAVSQAFIGLVGRDEDHLIGQPLASLWLPPERRAVLQRLDDVLLLGHDRFGALALARPGREPIWVEVEAHFAYHGGQRLELTLTPLVVPAGPPPFPPSSARGAGMALRARRRTARSDWTPPAAAPAGAGAGGGGEAAAIQALLTSALDAAGVAALAVGADGAIHAATPACEALFHRPPARLRGLSLERLVDLTPAAAEALAVARYAGTRQTVLAEAPGSEGQVVVEWVPGSVAGAGYALLQPNSGGTEASERLRFQSGLVSFVAHDLRDSLASVSSGLHILAAELPDESRLQSVVAQAQKENRRAHLMVEDVLAVSRPGRLTRAELDLAGLLVEAVQRFRPRANARGVQLCEAPMPGVRVMADASGLERAFANIIENALQAMEHGGTLTLAMGLQDRLRPGVLVAIADTGPGINPDIGTHIFEPFITDKDDGTGLGLAIARRVVLDHGGQLDFDSRPGAGTTFYVWLPRLG